MERFKDILKKLRDIDTDFYSMTVILTTLEKAYPIEKNPDAYSIVHLLSLWTEKKKEQINTIADMIEEELILLLNTEKISE